jgi:hypothetical protein
MVLDGSVVGRRIDATGFHSEDELSLQRTTISEAGLALTRATLAGLVDMDGMTCLGDLNADSVRVGGSFWMRSIDENKASFNKVSLRAAKIAGQLTMDAARFDGPLSLNGGQVGNVLLMRNSRFKAVDLRGARISIEIDAAGASFDGDLDARSLFVDGSLFLSSEVGNETNFKSVNLRNARVTAQADMSGATFAGDVDASFLHVGGSLLMRSESGNRAIFKKKVDLSGASIAGKVDMTGARFEGDLDADSLQAGESLLMGSELGNNATFRNVILRGTKVSGKLDMHAVTVDGDLDARFLEVGGALLMGYDGEDKTSSSFKKVDLRSAKISGELSMAGASLKGDLDAPFLQVGGSMSLRSDETKASFKRIDLSNAKIAGKLDFSGAGLDGGLNADFLQVGGSLLMHSDGKNKATFSNVNLSGAIIAGRVELDGAIFGGGIFGQGLRAKGDVSLRDVHTDGPFAMPFAQLGGNLEIRRGKLASLDLRGASIAGEMQLGDKKSTVELGVLDLRNAHIGSLSDNKYSWPKHLLLDGVAFAHLGGSEGDSGADMAKRGGDWWDRNFAQPDGFTSSPYEQLAAVFGAAGYRDVADEIHYYEQVRATEKSSVLGLAGSTLMRWGAGYGIGSYMFRALYWAIGLSLIGALILRFCVKGVADRQRGILWCFGASVNKLLPGVNLKKEFADFFDDPAHNKFTPRQDLFFVVLAALGWVLGLIVLAAFATITHGP